MEILYQDRQILVCVKPRGVVSTDEPGGLPELLRTALDDAKANLYTVHRLDQVVGGVMVLARTAHAAKDLSAAIKRIEFAQMNLLGFILNGIKTKHGGGSYSKSKYGNKYYYKKDYGYGYGYGYYGNKPEKNETEDTEETLPAAVPEATPVPDLPAEEPAKAEAPVVTEQVKDVTGETNTPDTPETADAPEAASGSLANDGYFEIKF